MIESNENTPGDKGDGAPKVDAAAQAREKTEQLLNEQYFARKPRAEIGATLMGVVDEYYDRLNRLGKTRLWSRCYDYFYRGEIRGAKLQRSGKQNEYILMPANHYRNILKHLLNGVTSQRPEPEPQAQNTDFDSMAQTIVARGVVNFYNRDKRLERYFKKAAEMCLVYGEGYVESVWDPTGGRDYMVNPDDPNSTIKEGDLYFCNLGPLDVIRDTTRDSALNHDWYIVRKFVNKYTMAAKYPQFSDAIISTTYDPKERRGVRLGTYEGTETDLVPVWTFYHEKTPAMPDGRIVEFIGANIVTVDGPLPYRKLPLYRVVPDDKDGTTFGYSIGFDLLPIQESIDSLYSTVVTNQANFGVQNIAVPKNANLAVTQVAEGLNLIEYDVVGNVPMKPEGMNLTNTPPEIFKFINQLEQLMETLSGVNSTVRGNPEANLKSGAALALVSSMAIQFNSDFQQSYAQLLEDVWTGIIEILQDFASTPRMARITGKANRPLMSSFTSKDIDGIQRVSVDLANPLMRTTAGKLQIAEDLMNKGLIKTPDEYITILNTGRLEPIVEGQQAQLLLIRAENESLGDGKPQQALLTDDHILHIQEHQAVLASPEARQKPEIVNATLQHLNEHIALLMSGDPLLQLLGQPSLAPMLPPPPPGGGGGGPSPKGPADAGGANGTGSVPDVLNPTPAGQQAAAKVNLPKMPTNPLNGQTFSSMGAA